MVDELLLQTVDHRVGDRELDPFAVAPHADGAEPARVVGREEVDVVAVEPHPGELDRVEAELVGERLGEQLLGDDAVVEQDLAEAPTGRRLRCQRALHALVADGRPLHEHPTERRALLACDVHGRVGNRPVLPSEIVVVGAREARLDFGRELIDGVLA